jgi:hypothetical protein
MRIAALYDIHGNLPALEAVLGDVRHVGVDQVVVGGNVLPGPMPHETLALLFDLEMPVHSFAATVSSPSLHKSPRGILASLPFLLSAEVQLRHTFYDLASAADRVRATKYPQANEFARHSILEPPSEEEMARAFANVSFR